MGSESVIESSVPFRHWIIDDFIPRSLVNAALIEWPDSSWPHWHAYSDRNSVKFATKDISRLPPSAKLIFDRLCLLDACGITGIRDLFPDTTAHGAGMHWLPAGGRLGIHLDSASHPTTGWSRRLSATVYLTGDESGDLVLCDNHGAESVRIPPFAGRLVIFETAESAYHGVPDVVAVDGGRKSIAAFFWSIGGEVHSRKSAEFV